MLKRISVPENIDVDATKRGVQSAARPLHRGREQIHVGKKLHPLLARELRQRLRGRVAARQHSLTGQELHVAHHREPARQLGQNSRVLAAQSGTNTIVAPIHAPQSIGSARSRPNKPPPAHASSNHPPNPNQTKPKNAAPIPPAQMREIGAASGHSMTRNTSYWLLNAASNEASGFGHSSDRTNRTASAAPCRRSMPASSHSIEMGPS